MLRFALIFSSPNSWDLGLCTEASALPVSNLQWPPSKLHSHSPGCKQVGTRLICCVNEARLFKSALNSRHERQSLAKGLKRLKEATRKRKKGWMLQVFSTVQTNDKATASLTNCLRSSRGKSRRRMKIMRRVRTHQKPECKWIIEIMHKYIYTFYWQRHTQTILLISNRRIFPQVKPAKCRSGLKGLTRYSVSVPSIILSSVIQRGEHHQPRQHLGGCFFDLFWLFHHLLLESQFAGSSVTKVPAGGCQQVEGALAPRLFQSGKQLCYFQKAKAPIHNRPEMHAATTVAKHFFFKMQISKASPDLALMLR